MGFLIWMFIAFFVGKNEKRIRNKIADILEDKDNN